MLLMLWDLYPNAWYKYAVRKVGGRYFHPSCGTVALLGLPYPPSSLLLSFAPLHYVTISVCAGV